MTSNPATRKKPWQVQLLTLFPAMFPGPLGFSLTGRALEEALWQMDVRDLRDYAEDKHKTVDDTPFGGGAGMVLKPDVVHHALASFSHGVGRLIYLSPRGKPLTGEIVKSLAAEPLVTLVCGRYEGLDERVISAWQMEEISLGDFVLAGGEIAALALIEAALRYVPGVLGNCKTVEEESFSKGLLEYPHYTRPAEWQGISVPSVLLSGHHEKVAAWRLEQAEALTKQRRPDLWQNYLQQNKKNA